MKPLWKIPLFCALLTAAQANGQSGYLGQRNLISVDPLGPFTVDAFSVQYSRMLNHQFAMRFEGKWFNVDRPLTVNSSGEPTNNWMGLSSQEQVGTVSGTGTGFAFFAMYSGPTGLSLPLGFYGTLGLEFMHAAYTEEHDVPHAPWRNEFDKRTTFDFEGRGTRLIFGFGQTMILVGNLTLDLGIECGVMWYQFTAINSSVPPMYTVPYDRSTLFGNLNTNLEPVDVVTEGDTEFRHPGVFFLEPRLRIGYVF